MSIYNENGAPDSASRSLYVLLAAATLGMDEVAPCNARALVISSIPSGGLLQRPLGWHHLPSDFLGVDAIPVEVATEMFVER